MTLPKKTFTSTVYIISKKKVLLLNHKKFNLLLGVGGHIEKNETPQEAAIREVLEEIGIKIDLVSNDIIPNDANSIRSKFLVPPSFVLKEIIGKDLINIDYIFYSYIDNCQKVSETKGLNWYSLEELSQRNINSDVLFYS